MSAWCWLWGACPCRARSRAGSCWERVACAKREPECLSADEVVEVCVGGGLALWIGRRRSGCLHEDWTVTRSTAYLRSWCELAPVTKGSSASPGRPPDAETESCANADVAVAVAAAMSAAMAIGAEMRFDGVCFGVFKCSPSASVIAEVVCVSCDFSSRPAFGRWSRDRGPCRVRPGSTAQECHARAEWSTEAGLETGIWLRSDRYLGKLVELGGSVGCGLRLVGELGGGVRWV